MCTKYSVASSGALTLYLLPCIASFIISTLFHEPFGILVSNLNILPPGPTGVLHIASSPKSPFLPITAHLILRLPFLVPASSPPPPSRNIIVAVVVHDRQDLRDSLPLCIPFRPESLDSLPHSFGITATFYRPRRNNKIRRNLKSTQSELRSKSYPLRPVDLTTYVSDRTSINPRMFPSIHLCEMAIWLDRYRDPYLRN
jgi:hypothetical protein